MRDHTRRDRTPTRRARRIVWVLPLLAVGAAGWGIGPVAAATPTPAAGPGSREAPHLTATQIWSTAVAAPAGGIEDSSPNVADLPGGRAVVVGDQGGYVDAYYLANGAQVPGWPFNAGSPISSTPSVASVLGNGLDSVFVGVGNVSNPYVGGYQAITPQGGNQWSVQESNPSTDPYPHNGVIASMAVGNLQGGADVVAGSLGENMYAMNGAGGGVLSGFPWFQADSSFATPALAPLNGRTDIVEGNDATAGSAYHTQYQNGGELRILNPTGNAGQSEPNGGQVCRYQTNQVVQSSPAVGKFLNAGTQYGIVAGFGNYYSGASNTDQLIAIDSSCQLRWARTLDGSTASSPALADVMGNGQLQVVESTGGSVWVLNAANGQPIWHQPIPGGGGSVVTADLTGSGAQDVLVPTGAGVEVLDGPTGQLLATLAGGSGANSPLVTADPNGSVGITVAGGSTITHYEVGGSNGSAVGGVGSWPMFHHDPQLTGLVSSPPPTIRVPCNAPTGAPDGYDLVASDGGIFNFGNLPFCGSTGAITLNRPMVGAAATRDGGGYWEVASDGGIFAFGDAQFYGSTGNLHLNKPIVGMAATPDDGGYWLVASDGGVFAAGDAQFYGSTGNLHLNQPVVGMAPTPDGKGYWLVAADGGIFSFGDASFHGSTGSLRLNKPIVGMAATSTGGGYWLVAADGGIFSFGDASFHGSTGSLRLNKPIVGMASTPDARGYWLVAYDGGIFTFGDAPFHGSTGALRLNKPMVGMAAAAG
jgi:hypothetical protein